MFGVFQIVLLKLYCIVNRMLTTREAIEDIEQLTAANASAELHICLAYSSTREMIDAGEAYIQDVQRVKCVVKTCFNTPN